MKTSKQVFLRSFLISFVIVFAIGALIFSWIMTDRYRSNQNQKENAASDYTAGYIPQDDEEINILLMLCETRTDVIDRFALLHIDPVDKAILVVGIPNNSTATVNIKTGTLSELYDYGGTQMAIRAVQNIFSITIDRYMRIQNEAMTSIIDMMGGVEYDVEYPAHYVDPHMGEIEVETGRQLLDGRRCVALFRNEVLGQQELVNQNAQIVAELISQRMNSNFSKKLDIFYKNVINLVDSDISTFDYGYRKNGFLGILNDDMRTIEPIEVIGTAENDTFIFSEETKQVIREKFLNEIDKK